MVPAAPGKRRSGGESQCIEPATGFDDWCWIDYYAPPGEVVHFKRKVYKQALDELARLLPPDVQLSKPLPPTAPQAIRKAGKRHKAPSFAAKF